MAERIVRAVHGLRDGALDPDFEIGLAEHLRSTYDLPRLTDLYARFATADTDFDALMRGQDAHDLRVHPLNRLELPRPVRLVVRPRHPRGGVTLPFGWHAKASVER